MSLNDSKIKDTQKHLVSLSTLAPQLNTASNELNKVVSVFDDAFKRLNIGLSTWVSFRFRQESERDSGNFDEDQVGYAKIDGKWGIALRRIYGNYDAEVFHENGPWLFSDAPRELRIASIDYIPKLIEQLGKEAFDTTRKVEEKTKALRNLASTLNLIANVTREGSK